MSRDRSGDEARTARSPLLVRLVLASFGILLWIFFGVLAWVNGGPVWLGVLAVVLIVVSIVDIVVVSRRRARGDTG